MQTKTETRGRKPLPLDKKKAPQATVKINDFILPFVHELKGKLKKGSVTEKTLAQLHDVLKGTEQETSVFKGSEELGIIDELQEKIHYLEAENRIVGNKLAKQNKIGLNHVMERDNEHLRAVQTEGKLNDLKSSHRSLRRDYDVLLHREYDCMAIKGNGGRCTKKAVVDAIQNGINIHVCVQHSKILSRNAE